MGLGSKPLFRRTLMSSINLEDLEEVLYQEQAIVEAEDVPALLLAIYERADEEPPLRIVKEAEENNQGDDW